MWWNMGLFYRNSDASKQWHGPRQPAKVIVKKNWFAPSNVVCLVEFLRCDSLGDCSKRACSRCGSLFSTTGTSPWLRRRYPALVNRNRVFLQHENARPHTVRTTIRKIRGLGGIELLTHPASVSIHGPFLAWKKFWKHWSCGSGFHRILYIKKQRLVSSRNNKSCWKMAKDHRIWWFLLSRVV